MTIQKPINSGFGTTTTAAEVIAGKDLTGKTAIVTGGYSGIGTETTRVLAEAGATVIVPARSLEKAQKNLEGIANVEIEPMDLLDPASIDAFAQKFIDSGRLLDILINSAGVMAAPLTRDARGYEMQFSANHLGHFQLAARLWPALAKAEGARVVAVSSRGHRYSGVDLEDPNYENRDYDKWMAYGQSKSANVLFAVELDKRGRDHGVRAFALHPGGIITDLMRHLTEEDIERLGVNHKEDGTLDVEEYERNNPALKTVSQGAATSIWCAVSDQLKEMGGVYCEDCDIAVVDPDAESIIGVKSWAIDPENAAKLWTLSEKLTNAEFKI